jgi:hypothetical protein
MDVGTPIPSDSKHAVSVALPRWQDNVDYEEGVLKLPSGYPRFVIHPLVRDVRRFLIVVGFITIVVRSCIQNSVALLHMRRLIAMPFCRWLLRCNAKCIFKMRPMVPP